MPPEDDALNIDTEDNEEEQTDDGAEAKDGKKEPEKRDGLSAEEKQRQREEYREKRRSNAELAAQLKAENAQLKKERDEALNKAQTVEEVNKVKAEMEIERTRFEVLADNGYNPALRKYITATDEAGILAEVEKMSKFFGADKSSGGDGSGKADGDDKESSKDSTSQTRGKQAGDDRPKPKEKQGELRDLSHLPIDQQLQEAAKDV